MDLKQETPSTLTKLLNLVEYNSNHKTSIQYLYLGPLFCVPQPHLNNSLPHEHKEDKAHITAKLAFYKDTVFKQYRLMCYHTL